MKKINLIILIFLTLLLTVSSVNAAITVNLEYPEIYDPGTVDTQIFTIVSSTIPSFNFVASGGLESDLNLTLLATAAGTYYYQIFCNNISYRIDDLFVNDTKTYNWVVFNISGGGTDTLAVAVDYSNINAPGTTISELEATIAALEAQILNLQTVITSLESNNTNLTLTIIAKESIIDDLNSQITTLTNERDTLEGQRNDLIAANSELQNTNVNLGTEIQDKIATIKTRDTTIESLDKQIVNLNNDISTRQTTINQLEGMFTFLYDKGEVEGLIHFNFWSAIIGALIGVGIFFVYNKQTTYSRKTLIDIIGDKFSGVPFLGTSAKRTPREWNMIEETEVRPDKEKEILKDKVEVRPKNTEELDIDNIPDYDLDEESLPETDDVDYEIDEKPVKDTTKKRKSRKSRQKNNYWDTPAGKLRKEKMRQAMKSE